MHTLRKFTLLMICVCIMIVVPIVIVIFGLVLTHKNAIVMEERVLAPEGWSIEKVAFQYAPVLFQAVNDQKPRWDYICRVDFDGDWDALNNSNNIQAKNAMFDAAIYYSVIESKTHFYITYSIFHALDWGFSGGLVRKWYENDIKNLQVVVEKDHSDSIDGKIVLLTLQDGEDFRVYNTQNYRFRRTKQDFADGRVAFLNDAGEQSKGGTHVAIFVEQGRHNLQAIALDDIRLTKNNDGYVVRDGITYLPSLKNKGETPKEQTAVRYALLDTSKLLWERNAVNPDELYSFFDRERFHYSDEYVHVSSVPMYFHGKQLDGYEANTVNPNVLPFLFGKGSKKLPQGMLFFNPIQAYNTLYDLPGCSLVYRYHPFAKIE